jgi:hypothetical protein
MSLILHIIDRFLIHFFSSAGIVLAATFALATLQRRLRWPWLPSRVQGQIILSALLVFSVAVLREPYDVSRGDPLAKSISDFISWASGCGVSVWGLWRLTKRSRYE